MRPGPRTRRGKFYDYLRKAGFLDFEAQQFSKRPELKKVDYFQRIVTIRRASLMNVRKAYKQPAGEMPRTDTKAYKAYTKRILAIYNAKGYRQRVMGSHSQLLVPSPWALLKAFEDEWKDKKDGYYAYISPYDRRTRGELKDIRKIEKGYKRGRQMELGL